ELRLRRHRRPRLRLPVSAIARASGPRASGLRAAESSTPARRARLRHRKRLTSRLRIQEGDDLVADLRAVVNGLRAKAARSTASLFHRPRHFRWRNASPAAWRLRLKAN